MTEEVKQENKEEPIKNENKTRADEYLDPKTKKFRKGNPGGPGRPAGLRDWSTDFNEAIKVIAKQTGKKESEIRTELLIRGISEARGGNFNFWREIIERDYGKAKENITIETKNKLTDEQLARIIRREAKRINDGSNANSEESPN
jgi:hypothetical protein